MDKAFFYSHLQQVLDALGPVVAVIAIGYLMRRTRFPGESFWSAAERLTYYVFFPALLVRHLADAGFADRAVGPLLASVLALLGAGTVVVFLLRPCLKTDDPGFTSVYQGTIRFNTYIGVAVSAALFGEPGLTAAAVVIAPLIPLVNVLSVAVLVRGTERAEARAGASFAAIVRNPLILACVLGVLLDLTEIGLPTGTQTVVDILSRPALPLGLLAVGAGLHFHAAIGRPGLLFATSGLKLVLMPALALAAAWLSDLDAATSRALVLFAALPGATSAYILARQMGGDEKLMAALITLQHGLAMITMPVVIILLMMLPG